MRMDLGTRNTLGSSGIWSDNNWLLIINYLHHCSYMLNPLYTENYNHNVLISSAGVTITYRFTSFSLNPLLMRRL